MCSEVTTIPNSLVTPVWQLEVKNTETEAGWAADGNDPVQNLMLEFQKMAELKGFSVKRSGAESVIIHKIHISVTGPSNAGIDCTNTIHFFTHSPSSPNFVKRVLI